MIALGNLGCGSGLSHQASGSHCQSSTETLSAFQQNSDRFAPVSKRIRWVMMSSFANRPVHASRTVTSLTHRLHAAIAGQGALSRIAFISEAVKARIVCVRMLPSMSAASNTLAAVSSSGASKMQT